MSKENNTLRFIFLVIITVFVSFYRLLPHPANFVPVGAASLFAGAYFGSTLFAIFVPLISLWLSDLILNNFVYQQYFPNFTLFYDGFYWQYLSFAAIVFIGMLLKNRVKVGNVVLASISGSVLFFVATNFGVWFSSNMYSKNLVGLGACYLAAIPFFVQSLLGDLVFCGVIFGIFEFLKLQKPAIFEAKLVQ